ncbi:unnamed protein product [Rhodiola kirilowii]
MFKIFWPAVGEALREMPLAELRAKYFMYLSGIPLTYYSYPNFISVDV